MLVEHLVRLLDGVTVATDVIDLLEILLGVHVGQATLFISFDFADYLTYQWVFQDNIAEALMMHSFENRVLVWPIQAHDVH